MDQKFVVVAQFRDLPQAGLAQSTLEAIGIQCFLDNQYTVGVNWLYSSALGGVKLKVFEKDVAQAQEVLSQRDIEFPIQNYDQAEQIEEIGCPNCGSKEITTRNYTRKLAAISLMLSLPFFFFLKRNHCHNCGHKWK